MSPERNGKEQMDSRVDPGAEPGSSSEGDSVGRCGCEAEAGARKAVAVDPAIKAAVLRRLARIEGQIRGLEKMVEAERYCADILVQVASVQEALRGVSRQLMRNHLEHCATAAIRENDASAAAMYDEILDLVYRHAR
jgi:DNA-binding FrmR family transcriptional regulator